MLIVEMIAKIRRAFFVQGKPIKAICPELRISRKVARKVLRSEATEFRYEREAQPLPKIGPWSVSPSNFDLKHRSPGARMLFGYIALSVSLCSCSESRFGDSKLTEPVTSRALPRRSASRRTYPLGARRGKIQGTANGGGGAAQRRFENHRFEGGGAKGHSERRIRQGRRNFVRDGESAHNIWAPIHKSRRISPRRVERILCQVIGDRAGVMTDALTWAGTFHGIGAGLLCDYTPRNGACRSNVRRTEHGCRGLPRQKIEAALVNKARPLFAGFPEDQGEAYATILSNHPRMSSKVSAT
jgi:hypothetical protein